jgi:catalase
MQMMQPKGRVNYEPNSLSADAPREQGRTGFRSFPDKGDAKGRIRPESFADHYSQARMFYASQSGYEQEHIARALTFELSKVGHAHVREAMVGHLRHIDEDLAGHVAEGMGMGKLPKAPPVAAPVQDLAPSPALQIIGKMKHTLEGRTIGILIDEGSDKKAIARIQAAAKKLGAAVQIVAPKIGGAGLSDGSHLAADGQLAGTPSVLFDAIAVILSEAGAGQLGGDPAAIEFVSNAFHHLKAISVDGGGGELLKLARLERDEGVFDAAEIDDFMAAAMTRQWEREGR